MTEAERVAIALERMADNREKLDKKIDAVLDIVISALLTAAQFGMVPLTPDQQAQLVRMQGGGTC